MLAVLAFLIVIAVTITVHELGHYLVGRACGIRAEVFSLGFGKPLVSRRDVHGTVWQLALIPLGGFVKFATSTPGALARPGEFEAASLPARFATIAAGPAANFVLAAVLFCLVAPWQERPQLPLVVKASPFAAQLVPGDVLLAVEGEKIETSADLEQSATSGDGILRVTVERDGERRIVSVPALNAAWIARLELDGAAVASGLDVGDRIVAVDGVGVPTFDALRARLQEVTASSISVTVERGGRELVFPVVPQFVDGVARLGIGTVPAMEFAMTFPGPLEAIGEGLGRVGYVTGAVLMSLGDLVQTGALMCNVSGPVSIAATSGEALGVGPVYFLSLLAAISIIIGVMNLLPIPVLDGGHIVFFGYEALSGRPPSDAFLRAATAVGGAIIFALVGVALVSDLFC